jgi:hypothetical protein
MTPEYDGAVNQRFRTVASPNGKTIIYPSTKDVGWGLSLPTGNDVKISLKSITTQDYLRWKMNPFDETLMVSDTKLTIERTAGTNKSIKVESNGLWGASVLYDSWLNVSASGIMNDTLTINFSENTGASDRKNRIYVKSNGGETKIITVTQIGKPSASGDFKDNEQVFIYPNPADHELFIESSIKGLLTVYNQSGQKVLDLDLEAGRMSVDVSNFINGIYFFMVVTDNTTITKRIIIK